MGYCVDCGLPIPDGQHTCSMCYGDPNHGRDGYYMAELERDAALADEDARWEQYYRAALERDKWRWIDAEETAEMNPDGIPDGDWDIEF